MRKTLFALILAVFLILVLPVSVSANSAEPPGMTIIVENAPDDISLSLELVDELAHEVRVQKAQKSWEVYFRLYYYDYFASGKLDGAIIRVESSGKCFSCPLPEGVYREYNTILTLDFETQTLTIGQRWWRQPLLTAIRVTLTLLVEGLIFFCCGFRSKRSWIIFFAVNLLTQGWLNYIINSAAFSTGYWLIGLYLAELVIYIGEVIAFSLAIKEKKKWQLLLYALGANTASLIAGLLLINYLPI